jgi:hypothetical protein
VQNLFTKGILARNDEAIAVAAAVADVDDFGFG